MDVFVAVLEEPDMDPSIEIFQSNRDAEEWLISEVNTKRYGAPTIDREYHPDLYLMSFETCGDGQTGYICRRTL